MVNVKYIENMRHSYSHLMVGIKLQLANESREKILEQFTHALKHLKDLDVNGCEYLAGVLLRRLRDRIEFSGYYINTGRANNHFEEASSKFEMGRGSRVESKEKAMGCFEDCIDLCLAGLREIIPATGAEKTRISIAACAFLVAVIALLVSIFRN